MQVIIFGAIVTLWHERSNQGYCTRSRPIAEVKRLRARLVIRWVTTCEARVLFVFYFFLTIKGYFDSIYLSCYFLSNLTLLSIIYLMLVVHDTILYL